MLFGERLCYMLSLYHLITQSWSVGDKYLKFLFLLFLFLVQHHLIRVQSGLTLSMTGLGRHTYPLQLTLQCFTALRGAFLLLSQALTLLFQPARIVTLPRDSLATIQFQNPLGDIVKEVAVVGHSNHRSLVLLQMLLQPVDALGIQMVGRLIEQQHVGFLQQQSAQSYTAALTTREILHTPIARRTIQRCHRTIQFRVHIPSISRIDDILQLSLTLHQFIHLVGILIVLGQSELDVYLIVFGQCIIYVLHAFHHVLFHRLFLVQWRFLWQIAHTVAGAPHHVALILLVEPCDNFHQGRFTSTVQSDDTNLGAIEKTQVNVFKHLLLILLDGFAHAHHREYHFLVVNCCHKYLLFFDLSANIRKKSEKGSIIQLFCLFLHIHYINHFKLW